MTVPNGMPPEAAQRFVHFLRACVAQSLEVRFHTMTERAIALSLHGQRGEVVGGATLWTSGEWSGRVIGARGAAVPLLREYMGVEVPPVRSSHSGVVISGY